MSTHGPSPGGLLSEPDSHSRGFRRIVVLLISLVTLPTIVLLAIGILMLVFYEVRLNVVFGVLVVTIVVCLITGTALALVFLRREARLSSLQSDFVSKVSHELRTPLTSIRLFVETLQSKRVPPEEIEAVVEALAYETGRLTERIERLLDWGRMEAGKRVYELRPDSVASIVDEAIGAFETATMGRTAEIEVVVDPSLPGVIADRGALVDALVNLLSNAYKYSGEEKQIRLEATADDRFVHLSVRDRGIGIPRTEHRRIFQKFYRVDERLSQAIEGSGLGLSIVMHVVRAHKGRVEVNSAPGAGSTFTILIPHIGAIEGRDPETSEAPAT